MAPAVVDALIAAGSLALFGLAYAGAWLATRPARPAAAPPTPELGDEPPAVVNLLANRWRLNEDAAEATLLDLAARRAIELRQPGADPVQTTIHLGGGGPPRPLRGYEQLVLDRVRRLAVGGVVPATALTFRNQREARSWNRRLRSEVVADARTRGLSRRRFSTRVLATLGMVGMVTVAGLVVAMLRYAVRDETTSLRSAIAVGIFGFGLLGWVLLREHGERDTAVGRAAAARWLGVREWLRGHEEFADLPPASVTVWDRYLPYGAALGVTHTASQVLDLGMGNRKRVWSSYRGRWRRIRVRYPRFWPRYGRDVPSLLATTLLSLVVGGLLVRFHRLPGELDPAGDAGLERGLDIASRVGLVLGVLLLVQGGYGLVRTLLDLATTRTTTGQVLWLQVWRSRSRGKNQSRVPWLHYLAVDDGGADRTTAWGLPQGKSGPRCRDGDTVTIRCRPWSRRVVELTMVERDRAHRPLREPVPGPHNCDTLT